MKSIFDIFKIRKDERWLAIVSALIFSFLNFMTVYMYWGRFCALSDNYHRLFVRWFRISGFDPLTYEVISYWDTAYNVYRHPLLAFFMWPFYQLNQLMMTLTGKNFSTVITALIIIFCAFYSSIFLFLFAYGSHVQHGIHNAICNGARPFHHVDVRPHADVVSFW